MAEGNNKPIIIAGGLVVTLAAAAAWYLIDRQRPVDDESQQALDQQMLSATIDLQEQLTGDIDERQLVEEIQRADSEVGLKLLGLCNAWIEFHENHPDDTTLENRERACGDYRRYIASGELPETGD